MDQITGDISSLALKDNRSERRLLLIQNGGENSGKTIHLQLIVTDKM